MWALDDMLHSTQSCCHWEPINIAKPRGSLGKNISFYSKLINLICKACLTVIYYCKLVNEYKLTYKSCSLRWHLAETCLHQELISPRGIRSEYSYSLDATCNSATYMWFEPRCCGLVGFDKDFICLRIGQRFLTHIK